MNKTLRFIVTAAAIAAVYVVVVLVFAPISFGAVQVRVAEALCVLPMLTPAAVPGLFVGCLLGNIWGGMGIFDIIFGSLATLVAAALTYLMRKNKWVAMVPPVAVNALVVGFLLTYVFKVGMDYLFTMLYVAAGQAIACYGVGIPLYNLLYKHKDQLFQEF